MEIVHQKSFAFSELNGKRDSDYGEEINFGANDDYDCIIIKRCCCDGEEYDRYSRFWLAAPLALFYSV